MSFFSKKVANPLTIDELLENFQRQRLAIGKLPLSEMDIPTEAIGATRQDYRDIYQKIKESNLDMDLVDFFCWISTLLIARIVINSVIKRQNSFDQVPAMLTKLLDSETADTKNMLRLFHADHGHFLNAIGATDQTTRRELYVKISTLWYDVREHEESK